MPVKFPAGSGNGWQPNAGMGSNSMHPQPLHVSMLPPFSNHRARCAKCGARYKIRVHFDRGCGEVYGGSHFHRICNCGHRWIERGSDRSVFDQG